MIFICAVTPLRVSAIAGECCLPVQHTARLCAVASALCNVGPQCISVVFAGLDCPVALPPTHGRTPPVFDCWTFSGFAHNAPDLHRQHCTSTQTSPASLAGGTSTMGLGGASTLAASRWFPLSGPTPVRLRETPAGPLITLVSLARSANAPLSHDNTGVKFGLLNMRSLTGKGHLIQDILTETVSLTFSV